MGLKQLTALAVVLVALPTTLAQGNGTSISNRIYGGMRAKPFRFTGWIKRNDEIICNFVLYRQRWIITAAHCFDELGQSVVTKGYKAVLGDFDRAVEDNEQQISACHIKIHPDYNKNTKENDIAVVKLSRPAALQRDNIELVPSINFGNIPLADLQAADCFLSGYGERQNGDKVNRRRKIDVDIETDGTCAGITNYKSATNLCYSTVDSGPCQLDGGAPLTCVLDGKQTLVGIHSFEPNGCNPGNQVATDIRQFRKFIKRTIEWVNHEEKKCADDELQNKKGCGPEGRHFLFNYIMPDPPDSSPVVYVTAKEDTSITLTAHPDLLAQLPGTVFDVSAANGLKIVLPTVFSKEYDGKDKLGIRIGINGDIPVLVMTAYEPDAIGGTYVFPEDCLRKTSRDYLVGSYQGGYRNQLCLSAAEDATFVTIERPHQSDIEFQLDEYESYCYISHEISGIIVRGSKRLAVFAGNKCAYVPEHVKYCDTLYEMMPPLHSLGKYHIIPRLLPRQNFILRILSQTDGTLIILRNADGTFQESQIRNRGKFWDTQVFGKPVVSVSCSQPCMVMKYSVGGTTDQVLQGDPSSVHIPHLDQFAFHYSIYATTTSGQHRIVIIIDKKADISTVKLNDNPIVGDFSTEHINIPSKGEYAIYYADLQQGVNTIKTTGSVPFGFIQYLLEFYRETAASPKCLSLDPNIGS